MSRMLIMSDLHLGHRNICKYRPGFASEEEHSEIIFDNLATGLTKRDTIWFLGDVAFTKEWLARIKTLKCQSKKLLVGNHDLERGITMADLVDTYDKCYALLKKRNYWFSHCPIHPDEMRGKLGNIHGHLHDKIIDDPMYINVSVEHTNYKPISIETVEEMHLAIQERHRGAMEYRTLNLAGHREYFDND